MFKVAPFEANTRKYCTQQCANEINIQKATSAAAAIKKARTDTKHALLRNDVIAWSITNPNVILNCPLNKISTTLKPIYDIAVEKYNISDWRSIANAVCGSSSKKDLLLFLKEKVENVR